MGSKFHSPMMILTIRQILVVVSAYSICFLLTNEAHIASDMSISDVANDSSILSTEGVNLCCIYADVGLALALCPHRECNHFRL